MTEPGVTRSMGRALRRVVAVSLGLGIGVGLGVLATAGCADRTYLTASHGRAYHEAFGRQEANPTPRRRDGRALEGMDAQEAASVSRTYRRTQGTNGGDTSAPPMVIMSPQAAPPMPYMPPPSVPQH